MMEEMRRKVRDASLIVKNLFNQYDLHVRGCVSGEQFLRVISCHDFLSADKVLQAFHVIPDRDTFATTINICCPRCQTQTSSGAE